MIKYSIYYWRDIREFIHGDKTPTIADVKFERTHRNVYSAVLFDKDMLDDRDPKDVLWHLFNAEGNPLGTGGMQAMLRGLMEHPHTSMSVGDVIRFRMPCEIDDDWWIVRSIGFERLEK